MRPTFKSVCLRAPASVALVACALLVFPFVSASAQSRGRKLQNPTLFTSVPKNILLQIVRAEDERRWDNDLRSLLSARSDIVRQRAALATGRIGNEAAVADLILLLEKDSDPDVRAMAAFALGEIESPLGADALVEQLKFRPRLSGHAQALEALGKIAAALPKEQAARAQELASVVLETLAWENRRRSASDEHTVLLGLTAVLRAKPDNAGSIVAEFLRFQDPRIRADAANTLARLKLKDGNEQLRKLLLTDPDPIVRANAARVLGATEDKASFEELLDRASKDKDSRVRVSAIRALASLKDERAARQWLAAAGEHQSADGIDRTDWTANEALEVATALGRILAGTEDKAAFEWLRTRRERIGGLAPEVEVALARVSAASYLALLGTGGPARKNAQRTLLTNWRSAASIAQGLGEIAARTDADKDNKEQQAVAADILRGMLRYRSSGIIINTLVDAHSQYALPDVLRAYAAFKPNDLADMLRQHLLESDVIIRGTAADLLGELPPDETNTRALVAALRVALADQELNDAALSILDSLAKQKSAPANEAIKTALNSSDYLIRRRAVALLKVNDIGDFSSSNGIVRTRNTAADYERAIKRIGKQIDAVVTTDKGSFTIRLLPDEAPLTVDNFIQLAKRKYFKGITIHRVVPNFVVQDGDPRGDGNGGPGYQIRCEINEVPYERGVVGMALSGKDTGGSQWFVTHSPQPHLDGGYTVFGKVLSGMDVVDKIVRGDVIRSIRITEIAADRVKQRR